MNEDPAAEERPTAPAGNPPQPESEPPADIPPAEGAPREGEWDTWHAPGFEASNGGWQPGDSPSPGDEADNATARDLARKNRTRTLVRELVETGLLALLVFLAVRSSFQNYRVHGHSMDPTLEDGEFLLVNRLEYAQIDIDKLGRFIPFLDTSGDDKRDVFHGPERGDIIILEDPRDPSGDRLVKRVIGLPGEKLEIVNGVVYINGHKLDEPYIKQVPTGNTPAIVLPPNEYFVMGDNRNNSDDSRFLGLIPRDLILGKATVSFWPKDKFGLAPNETPTLEPEVTR